MHRASTSPLCALALCIPASLGGAEFATAKAGPYGVGSTWAGGSPPAPGAVVVIGHPVTATALRIARDTTLTIAAGGGLRMDGDLTIDGGTLVVDGGSVELGPAGGGNRALVLRTGALRLASGTLTVNGSVALAGGGFTMDGGALVVDPNSGSPANSVEGKDTFAASAAVAYAVTGGTITIVDPPLRGPGRSFAFGGAKNGEWTGGTLVLGGEGGTNDSAAPHGFAIDTAATGKGWLRLGGVTANGGAKPNRFLSGPADPGHGFDIGGTLTVAAGSEVRTIAGGPLLRIQGDLLNDGRFVDDNGIAFGRRDGPNIASQKVVRGKNGLFATSDPKYQNGSNQIFNRLEFDNTATPSVSFNPGKDGKQAGDGIAVLQRLAFIHGAIDAGGNQQFLVNDGCAIARQDGYLIRDRQGEMVKMFPAGRSTFVYHIGDRDGHYTPVVVDVAANSMPRRAISVFVQGSAHPQLAAGGTPTAHLARWWNIVDGAAWNPTCTYAMTVTLAYAPGDVVGDESLLKACLFNGKKGSWTVLPSTVVPARHLLSFTYSSDHPLEAGDRADFSGRAAP